MARKLYIDTDAGRLVSGLNSSIPPDLNTLFEGDAVDYELYFVKRDPLGVNAYEPQNLSAASVSLHIGEPRPSTATAFVAQNTWTDLPATVTATVTRTVTGGVGLNEQQAVAFSPEVYSGTFSLTFPSRTVALTGTITSGLFTAVSAHGLALSEPFLTSGISGAAGGLTNGQTLFVSQVLNATQFSAATAPNRSAATSFSASSPGSALTITATSRLIDARGTAQACQSALETVASVGAGNVTVVAAPGRQYRISYENEKSQVALPLPTIADALTPIYGKTALVNFNTTTLVNALSASATIDAVLEVETTESGAVETVLQVPVLLRNDIISGTSPLPPPTTTAPFFYLASPDASVFAVSVDNSGVLTTEKIS
jgi:hypothetical protein